jgi:hypothetical protein
LAIINVKFCLVYGKRGRSKALAVISVACQGTMHPPLAGAPPVERVVARGSNESSRQRAGRGS